MMCYDNRMPDPNDKQRIDNSTDKRETDDIVVMRGAEIVPNKESSLNEAPKQEELVDEYAKLVPYYSKDSYYDEMLAASRYHDMCEENKNKKK